MNQGTLLFTRLKVLLAAAVLLDLGLAWFRLLTDFHPNVLVFRVIEGAIKLSVLALALQGRRWAYVLQLLIAGLAFASSMSLFHQANKRALHDPLTWISLAAQIVAGLICIALMAMRPTDDPTTPL